jgi:cytochrome c-type biogenesis protein CcmE
MKLSYIIGIIIIAVAVAVIATTSFDAGTYADFGVAKQLASDGNNKEIHVVGTLKKDALGKVVGLEYQPEIDPNQFAFQLIDTKNQETKVIYSNAKPQDFEKSEKVVIIGKMKGNVFYASKIQMKCPSKYQEDVKFKTKDNKQAGL